MLHTYLRPMTIGVAAGFIVLSGGPAFGAGAPPVRTNAPEPNAEAANPTVDNATAKLLRGVIQVVETPTHDFRFYRDGRTEIAIKGNGGFIGDPIRIAPHAYYWKDKKGGVVKNREVRSYVQDPVWNADKQSILHQVLLDDAVRMDIYYQVKSGTLLTGLFVKEPDSFSYPGEYSLAVNKLAVLTFDNQSNLYKGWLAPEGITGDKLPAKVKGMQVNIKKRDAAPVVYPYAKSTPSFIQNAVSEISIIGVYGKQVADFDLPVGNGEFTPSIYSGNQPCTGYMIAFSKKKLQTPADTASELMRLTIK